MKADKSPVSHVVNVARLPEKGTPVHFTADEEQRAALADMHGLLAVEGFEADLVVHKWKRDGVRVEGKVMADVVQSCVVTMEPLPAHVEAPFSAIFVPEGSALARADHEGGEIIVDAEAEDLPEPFSGNQIDVGAVAEEFFELALDPYPRKEGAELPAETMPLEEGEAEEGQLAKALRKLSPGS